MAPATRKPRATIVNREQVGQAKTLLQELPEKTKEDLSLREAVDHLEEDIKAAIARGYNYEDIAKLLSQQGIKISMLTLKNYVPLGKRQLTKAKTKRTKKTADETATPASEPATVAPEPAPPPPTPAKRGRAKATGSTPPAETPSTETPTTAATEPKKPGSRTRKTAAKATKATPQKATPKKTSTRGRKKATAS